MRTRAVTITLRLVVPDDPTLGTYADFMAERPPVTFLGSVLDSVGSVLLQETLSVLREEFGESVEAISHRHTIEAPTNDSEDW